jgi:hypothetical protein
MRAILLASATAATLRGRRPRSLIIHAVAFPGRAQRNTLCAPMIRRRRRFASPCLLIRPRRGLPPVELWRGTSPSQAANWRPLAKLLGSGTDAAIALAMTGPIPGMVAKRRLASLAWCQDKISASMASICYSLARS